LNSLKGFLLLFNKEIKTINLLILLTMKKMLFFVIAILYMNFSLNGQYKVNKMHYDYRTYSYQLGDPYNPTVAGVTSFLLPGLGQMFSGEGGRGVAFLGGYLGCAVMYGAGFGSAMSDLDSGGDGSSGANLMLIGGLGLISISIWAIVDAVHVAKVNNLAFRALNKYLNYIQIQPYIINDFYAQNESFQTGLTLKVRF